MQRRKASKVKKVLKYLSCAFCGRKNMLKLKYKGIFKLEMEREKRES